MDHDRRRGSLRRRTDYIDLYQVHRPDPATDVDGIRRDRPRAPGQGRAIGTSAFPVEQIVEAQWVSERRGHERFATEQPSYSIFARHAGGGFARRRALWARGDGLEPLNGGWLSGKYQRGAAPGEDSRAKRHPDHFDLKDETIASHKLDLVEQLQQLASEADHTLIELALGFIMAHRAVTSAIIGPRTYEHLEGQLPALGTRLSEDVLDRIDELVAPGLTINVDDVGWSPPALSEPALRRR